MFRAECDICKMDCNKVATFVEVKQVQNYATSNTDVGNPIGKIVGNKQFCLCQKSYKQLNLPNIYKDEA